MTLRIVVSLFYFVCSIALAAPDSFDNAKELMREKIYFDQNSSSHGSTYCGCKWKWAGASGGVIDLGGCGYEPRKQLERALRLEWEHVVPAWVMGHQRQCWQEGGRSKCVSSDPVFRVMEADMHNLVPSVGEVNGDRSNYSFGVLPSTLKQYGQCNVKVNFSLRTVEPRDEIKGLIARIYFYIHDRYDLRMSRQEQQLMMAWDKMYPVTPWELERDRRIAEEMGHHNPFVNSTVKWSKGHRNTREGITSFSSSNPSETTEILVRGNRNSKVYHLSVGCPSYRLVSERNRVQFNSVREAELEGYRRAGNCR